MFVVILTYQVPLEAVDGLLEEHVAYLNEGYAKGVFLASGRQVPRTGGVILARAESRAALEAFLARDPFAKARAATYQVIEWTASKACPELASLTGA